MKELIYHLLVGYPLSLAIIYYAAFVISRVAQWFEVDFIFSLGTFKIFVILFLLSVAQMSLSYFRKSILEEAKKISFKDLVEASLINRIVAFVGISIAYFYAFLIKTFII